MRGRQSNLACAAILVYFVGRRVMWQGYLERKLCQTKVSLESENSLWTGSSEAV